MRPAHAPGALYLLRTGAFRIRPLRPELAGASARLPPVAAPAVPTLPVEPTRAAAGKKALALVGAFVRSMERGKPRGRRGPIEAGSARAGALAVAGVRADAGFTFAGARVAVVGHGTRSGSGGRDADCLSRASRGRTAGAGVFPPLAMTLVGHGTRCGTEADLLAARRDASGAGRHAVVGSRDRVAGVATFLPLDNGSARDAPVNAAG